MRKDYLRPARKWKQSYDLNFPEGLFASPEQPLGVGSHYGTEMGLAPSDCISILGGGRGGAAAGKRSEFINNTIRDMDVKLATIL